MTYVDILRSHFVGKQVRIIHPVSTGMPARLMLVQSVRATAQNNIELTGGQSPSNPHRRIVELLTPYTEIDVLE